MCTFCTPNSLKGRDYSTVDGRSKRKCYWTRASCDCGRLPFGNVSKEGEFLSIDYTNPNTNPKPRTTLVLSLADHHNAFESFHAPAFCDFVGNYSCTVDGAVVTSIHLSYRLNLPCASINVAVSECTERTIRSLVSQF